MQQLFTLKEPLDKVSEPGVLFANIKNIRKIVGMKLGNVGKKPKSVKVLTRKDMS